MLSRKILRFLIKKFHINGMLPRNYQCCQVAFESYKYGIDPYLKPKISIFYQFFDKTFVTWSRGFFMTNSLTVALKVDVLDITIA